MTADKIQQKKERFLDLISSITLQNSDISKLIKWLEEKSDFFTAPATTKYHGSYEGGLCQHSLNVYDNLVKLVEDFATVPDTVYDLDESGAPIKESIRVEQRPLYSSDSIKIVALMHDISKSNFFESYMRNVKNDDTGKWDKVQDYKYKDASDRFILGNQEQNSEYITHTFFPLSVEESSAILNHLGGKGNDSAQNIAPTVFTKYSLALLLHMADLVASYIDEKVF